MLRKLPLDGWIARPDLHALVMALGADKMRYVGGAVRDTLLGLAVKDIDAATLLHPDAVIAACKAAGLRTVPTGLDHGTVTVLCEGGAVEVTTLRHDVSTDGRRATVAFASDWREDAARRDFTINALYADPLTGEIHDYFGGLDDLATRHVRFIGDARQRIREDHLRILRYFRFQARFGSVPADAEAESACAELAATLKGLSRERIGMEVMNLLGLADPAPTMARMAELGVLAEVLPEAQVAQLAALVEQERKQDVPRDALRRLASLLPREDGAAAGVAARFRLSGAQKKRLVAATQADAEAAPKALAYALGVEVAVDAMLLSGRDIGPLRDGVRPFFALKGGAVVERGVMAGPEVMRILRAVEQRWIAEDFPDEARTLALLDEVLAQGNAA